MKNKFSYKDTHGKRIGAWVMAVSIFCAIILPFKCVFAMVEVTEKAIGLDNRTQSLKVSFELRSSSYRVGEAIRFNVKGNKDFYLYVFAINEAERRAVLLIPNEKRRNRYRANRVHIVPDRGVEFFADRQGIEKVLMVATTRYVDVNTKGYRKVRGYFLTTPARVKFHVKSLGIQKPRVKGERVVKVLYLNIKAPAYDARLSQSSSSAPDWRRKTKAIAFVSSDRVVYRTGEIVRIAYGADRAGWIRIFALGPEADTTLLKKRRVSGKDIYHLRARAEHPTGPHKLVAVYTTGEAIESQVSPQYIAGLKEKALIPLGRKKWTYAVSRLDIIKSQQGSVQKWPFSSR